MIGPRKQKLTLSITEINLTQSIDFSLLLPEGIQKFKGQYFHSRQYKHPEGFERKRILVIGIGNSASDIAVELSKKAAQVRCSLITAGGGKEERGGAYWKIPLI